jgi:putative nucleotidyltransferase with HDIG domain
MRDLMELGLLDRFAPEFRAMEGVDQGRYHHLDVWEHTLLVVENLFRAGSPEAGVRARMPALHVILAALLHDVGKPSTWSADYEANIRFYGHETVGAEMAEKMLRRLKFSNEDIAPVVSLVKNHMRLGSFKEFTPTAARRLLRDMGDLLEPLFDLVEADAASLRPGVRVMDLAPIRERVAEVSASTPADSLESPLSGDEIMALLEVEPGPEVGRLKQAILNEVLEGRIDPGDKVAAQRFLKQLND